VISHRCAAASPGELGEEAKEFRATGKEAGEECTQGTDRAERTTQIHVLAVSAENGGQQHRTEPSERQASRLGQCSGMTVTRGGAVRLLDDPARLTLASVVEPGALGRDRGLGVGAQGVGAVVVVGGRQGR
jgi:hypothetical protein